MKKILLLSSALFLSAASPIFANDVEKNNTAVIQVVINDNLLSLAQEPIVMNDRTLVPLRAINEYLGASISWDNTTKTVTVQNNSDTIQLTIENQTAFKNGVPLTLDVPPIIVNGRALVPARFLANSLEAEVNWDDKSRTVSIKSDQQQMVASIPGPNIALYAVEKDGFFEDFKLEMDGNILPFPEWSSTTGRNPELFFEDINRDGNKELVIVLTKGYGTGALDQEIHVFQKNNTGDFYAEVLVENPMAIVLKNIQTKLTSNEAEIMIGHQKDVVNISKLQISSFNLFDDIGFGNSIHFDVVNNRLISNVSAYISPAGYLGNVQITYAFKNKMYQVEEIGFTVSPLLEEQD